MTCFRNTGGVTQCKNKWWQYLSLFANHRYAACCCVGSIWNVLLWQHCAYDLRLRKRYSFGLKYLLGSPQTHLAIVQGLIKNARYRCWNTASNCGHWLGSVLACDCDCIYVDMFCMTCTDLKILVVWRDVNYHILFFNWAAMRQLACVPTAANNLDCTVYVKQICKM